MCWDTPRYHTAGWQQPPWTSSTWAHTGHHSEKMGVTHLKWNKVGSSINITIVFSSIYSSILLLADLQTSNCSLSPPAKIFGTLGWNSKLAVYNEEHHLLALMGAPVSFGIIPQFCYLNTIVCTNHLPRPPGLRKVAKKHWYHRRRAA
jgi:hypothetical protein